MSIETVVTELDGREQPETQAEHTHRIVDCAVRHLVETGLLVIPPDIAARLAEPIPLWRNP